MCPIIMDSKEMWRVEAPSAGHAFAISRTPAVTPSRAMSGMRTMTVGW
jgi:hypothetical protein